MGKVFVLCLFVFCSAFVLAQKHYCADMKPQNSVDIRQLLGMWFGIEILSHRPDEEGIVEYYDSCPVIHISEVLEPTTVPAYGYGAEYGYGEEYGRTYTTRLNTTPKPTAMYDEQQIYGKGAYSNTPYLHRHQKGEELKKLRVLWDESGVNIEYTLKYNKTRAGFWISSGPQNGSMLERQYNQFAGTVQVMKAVGNHLVLTFCHQLPDRQLFSILLARERRLTFQEIQGVHNLLNRRDLTIGNIRKVCNSASGVLQDKLVMVVLVAWLLWFGKYY